MDSKGFLLRRTSSVLKGGTGDILYLTIFYTNNDPRNGIYKWTEKEGLVFINNPIGNFGAFNVRILGSYDGNIVYVGANFNGRLYMSINGAPFVQRDFSNLTYSWLQYGACSGDGSILYLADVSVIYKAVGLNTINVTNIYANYYNNNNYLLCNEEGNAILFSSNLYDPENTNYSYINSIGLSPEINKSLSSSQTSNYRLRLIASSSDFNMIYLLYENHDDSGVPYAFLYSNNKLTSWTNIINGQQIRSATCNKDGSKAFLSSTASSQSYLRAYLNGSLVNTIQTAGTTQVYKNMVYSGNDMLYLTHNDNRRVFKSGNGVSPLEEIINIGSTGTILGLFTNIDKR